MVVVSLMVVVEFCGDGLMSSCLVFMLGSWWVVVVVWVVLVIM